MGDFKFRLNLVRNFGFKPKLGLQEAHLSHDASCHWIFLLSHSRSLKIFRN